MTPCRQPRVPTFFFSFSSLLVLYTSMDSPSRDSLKASKTHKSQETLVVPDKIKKSTSKPELLRQLSSSVSGFFSPRNVEKKENKDLSKEKGKARSSSTSQGKPTPNEPAQVRLGRSASPRSKAFAPLKTAQIPSRTLSLSDFDILWLLGTSFLLTGVTVRNPVPPRNGAPCPPFFYSQF